mgnify:CR=1 FL=1
MKIALAYNEEDSQLIKKLESDLSQSGYSFVHFDFSKCTLCYIFNFIVVIYCNRHLILLYLYNNGSQMTNILIIPILKLVGPCYQYSGHRVCISRCIPLFEVSIRGRIPLYLGIAVVLILLSLLLL